MGVQTPPSAIKAPGVPSMCSQGLEPLVQTLILSVSQQRGKLFPGADLSAACQSIRESMHLTQLRGHYFSILQTGS